MDKNNSFFGKLTSPFRSLSSFKKVFQSSSKRGKTALISSTLVFGGGNFFTGHFLRGISLLLIEAFVFLYFIFFGFEFLIGKRNFPGMNLQLVNIILLLILLYFYFREIERTLMIIKEGKYEGGLLKNKIKTKQKRMITDFYDYGKLWKQSGWKKRFDLLSPYFLMGFYQLKKKSYFKAIIYILLEFGFIFYLLQTGIYDLIDFFRLETDFRPSTFNLVYGFVAIAVITIFLYFYIQNIKNVTKAIKFETGFRSLKDEVKSLKDEKLYLSFLFLPVLGVILFTVVPLIFMISIAFTGYQGSSQNFVWTGFESFRNLFLVSENLYTLLSVTRWTLIWAFLATFSNYFGGIFLALLINKKGVKGKKFWRTIFIITMAVPQFVSLLIMNQMFSYDGPVNQFLLNLGLINQKINFWGVQWRARTLIIIINMWVGIPYLMLLTSGILMNIPVELYEAATLEGANKWQLFTKVTMPYMLFVTTPLLVTGFVGNINNFNVIFLLTGGKPLGVGLVNAGGTDILITWLYQLTKTHRMYNLSAAIGIIIFLISAIISLSIYRKTSAYKNERRFSQ